MAEIERQAYALARALGVCGLMNVQMAVKDGEVFILEVNPRASRTVPFVAKAIGSPLPRSPRASWPASGWPTSRHPATAGQAGRGQGGGVPFARFPGVDLLLGPEMKSTGEVMGLDRDFAAAFVKSQLEASTELPAAGTVFVSVRDRDKGAAVELARRLRELGFDVAATRGTAAALRAAGIAVTPVKKVHEGRPHVVDMIKNGEVAMLINTTEGRQAIGDSYTLRRAARWPSCPTTPHCRVRGPSCRRWRGFARVSLKWRPCNRILATRTDAPPTALLGATAFLNP